MPAGPGQIIGETEDSTTGGPYIADVNDSNRLLTDSELSVGDVPVDSTNPLPVTSISHTSKDLEGKGALAVGSVAVEIAFTGITESIIISSAVTNTGLIYVGKSDVTNTGSNSITFLEAGQSLTIDYEDSTNAIYAVADTAAQSVFAGAAL